MKPVLLAGLDIGSSGAKITVMDISGTVKHTGYRNYPVSRRQTAHEADAAAIWDTAKALLSGAAEVCGHITGMGLTSFGESFVLLDGRDEPVYPIMLYTDPRGAAQSERLAQSLGAERIADIAGALPHPMFSLPKLMWVRDEQPEVFGRVKRFCLIADYIAYKLTGEHVIDHSMAARTMAFDIRLLAWSEDLLGAADIGAALFGTPVPSGYAVGTVKPELAAELGVNSDMTVVLCGQDQIAASVGSQAVTPGIAANGAGTVECVTPVYAGIPEGIVLQKRNFPIVPFLQQGLYASYAFSFSGGCLIQWFLSQLAEGTQAQAKALGRSVYDLLESGAPDTPTGILVLPHFAGAATPYMDTGSKGVFAGLDLSHTTADLYRAVLEGIVYEIKINLEALQGAGITVSELHASGGGARSALWLQMKADILGIPIIRMSQDQAGTVGSIAMTGVAAGVFSDLDSAVSRLNRPLHRYEPRPEQQEAYAAVFTRYRHLYDAVRGLMK